MSQVATGHEDFTPGAAPSQAFGTAQCPMRPVTPLPVTPVSASALDVLRPQAVAPTAGAVWNPGKSNAFIPYFYGQGADNSQFVCRFVRWCYVSSHYASSNGNPPSRWGHLWFPTELYRVTVTLGALQGENVLTDEFGDLPPLIGPSERFADVLTVVNNLTNAVPAPSIKAPGSGQFAWIDSIDHKGAHLIQAEFNTNALGSAATACGLLVSEY